MKAAVIFGSSTGNTEVAADMIIQAFLPEYDLPAVDVARLKPEDLKAYDLILAAVPTWNIGELETGWMELVEKLPGTDLTGVRVAIIGMGDQANYADTYQDAMGLLYEALLKAGATGGLGFTSTQGHDFTGSLGIINGQFCGLALDDDNQAGETEDRILHWAAQMKEEIKARQLAR